MKYVSTIKSNLYLSQNESEEIMSQGSPMPETLSEDSSGMGILTDSFMEPLLDPLSSSQLEEFNFEYSDHNYRFVIPKCIESSVSKLTVNFPVITTLVRHAPV